MAAKFEILQPKPGEFRWVLTSQGRVLARSETYTRKVSCQNALESFRKAAPSATVDDQTVAVAPKGRAPQRAAAKPVPAKAARTTGRVVGKAAAKVKQLVESVEEAVAPKPAPRKRAPRAAKAR
jgi:uncharacterized protein YegP (UPF0339 family)